MYLIKPQNSCTTVRDDEAPSLAKAREIAKAAVSSAMGDPARACIYHQDENGIQDEPIEVYEDGRRKWYDPLYRQKQYEARQKKRGWKTISLRLDSDARQALAAKAEAFGGDQSACIRALLLS
jgi:hypothetical protein